MKNIIRQAAHIGLLAAGLLLATLLAQIPTRALATGSSIEPWAQLAKLTASDGSAGDWLGFAVAFSGNIAVVGAPYDDPNGIDSGSVYLYAKGRNWTDKVEIAKLSPSQGDEFDLFGSSVAITDDTVIVGAPAEDSNGSAAGIVYIFEKPDGGWHNMTESAKLTPSDPSVGDWFGSAVAAEGDTIVVGASHSGALDEGDSGVAYIFIKLAAVWTDQTEAAKIGPSDGAAWDGFGFSTAISQDTITVGAPFDDDNGRNSGSAYVFVEPNGGWSAITETAKLKPAKGADYDWFGRSVDISGDNITVGAPQNDEKGTNAGAAYLFVKPQTGWQNMTETAQLRASDAAKGDNLGWSVAIDGRLAAAGAPSSAGSSPTGKVYIYEQPAGGWTSAAETLQILPSDASPLDRFGISVAGSGRVFLVGADSDDDNGSYSGAAYLFAQTGTIEIIKSTLPEGGSGFIFSHNIPGDESGFILDHGLTRTFHQVPCGTYNLFELGPTPAYDLTSLDCTDSDDSGINSSVDLAARTAAIQLDPGEIVTCHFYNTQRGKILVDKVVRPESDQTAFSFHITGGPDNIANEFSLTADDPPNENSYLKPGEYSVEEISLDGWEQHTAVCTNDSDPNSITLPPGGAIACTFTSTKQSKIIVNKLTIPAGHNQSFTFTLSSGPDSVSDTFSLSAQDAAYNSGYLSPGFYSLNENLPAFWKQDSAVCDNNSPPNQLQLPPGESVQCTFTNSLQKFEHYLPFLPISP